MDRLSATRTSEIWDRFEAGESQRSIPPVGSVTVDDRTHLVSSGVPRRPLPGSGVVDPSCCRMTEREEISRGSWLAGRAR